jgi:hypothetical protein
VIQSGHEATRSLLPSAKVKNISALYVFSWSCTLLSTRTVLPVVTSLQLHFIREDHHVNRNIFREGSDKIPVLTVRVTLNVSHVISVYCSRMTGGMK